MVATTASLSALAFALTTPAYAGSWQHGGRERGDSNDRSISAYTQTRAKITKPTVPAGGKKLTAVDTDWTPPPCWYEPFHTPKEFKYSIEHMKEYGKIGEPKLGLNAGQEAMQKQFKEKKDVFGGPAYKDYNLNKQGKGMWWHGVVNPNQKFDYFSSADCFDTIFWADKEKAPKPAAISPKVLAGYAYDSIKVPDTKVTMNPKGKSTVNLPTWMWLDKAKFKPVKVTASLPGTGLTATTTAKPKSLHLDPGTPDAKVFPSTGECPLNKDGSIGKPYTKGHATENPPCGVTYERATTNSPPHKLKATITWQISWTGSNNEGGKLPNGAFDTTQNIPVQEHQSVVQ